MALQPQVVTRQAASAGLSRYSPQGSKCGFARISTPLYLHLEKFQPVPKAQPTYSSNGHGKSMLRTGVVLAQSSQRTVSTLEEAGTTGSASRDNAFIESSPIQLVPNEQPSHAVQAVAGPQDNSSALETLSKPLGATIPDSSTGVASMIDASRLHPLITSPDIITSNAEESINSAAIAAASDSSSEAANNAAGSLSTDQFKSAKEAYEAMLSGTGDPTETDSSIDALSQSSKSLADGFLEAKSAIIDSLTKLQESIQNSVDSVKNTYDNINGSIANSLKDATGLNEKATSLGPKIEKVGSSTDNYLKIVTSPFQMGTPVNNALKQFVTATENITGRALVGAGELVANGYSSTKELLPENLQAYLNGFEKNLAEVFGPAQTAFQQVYGIVLDAERTLGINPENPIIPLAFVVGGSFSLVLLYRQLRYGGYSGDLAPDSALELLKTEGNIVLIDIRSEDLRESEGMPDLRRQVRFKAASVAQFKVQRSLQKMLRSNVVAEAAITASTIKNLKNVQRSTKVILLDSDGSESKAIARALKKAGIKMPYRIDGGFRAWKADGLRVKQVGPETPLTIIKEETEAILDEVKPTPLGIGAASLGVFAGIYTLIEWEKTLQFLGLVCICQVLYIRLNSYESADDVKKDLKLLLRPLTLATQGIVWAAGAVEPSKLQLATSPSSSAVQDRVVQAAAKHGPLPSETDQEQPEEPLTGEQVESKAQE